MTIGADALTDLPPHDLPSLSRLVRDGDVFLCSGNDPFSKLIGWATDSPWTHVALAYRWPSLGRIMVFESVQHYGVRAVSLHRFISQSSTGQRPYPGQIVLARHEDFADHHGKAGSAAHDRLAAFAIDRFGDPFAAAEILNIAARIAFGKLNRPTPKVLLAKDAYICSEYAACCFQKVGIDIAWDGRGFIAPADFALDPKMRAVARVKTQ